MRGLDLAVRRLLQHQLPLAIAFAASLLLHALALGVGPGLDALHRLRLTETALVPPDADDPAAEAPAPEDLLRPGREAGSPATLTWIGYDEYQRHLAELESEVDQAAFTAAEALGRPDAAALDGVPSGDPGEVTPPAADTAATDLATPRPDAQAVRETPPAPADPSASTDPPTTLRAEAAGPAASPVEPAEAPDNPRPTGEDPQPPAAREATPAIVPDPAPDPAPDPGPAPTPDVSPEPVASPPPSAGPVVPPVSPDDAAPDLTLPRTSRPAVPADAAREAEADERVEAPDPAHTLIGPPATDARDTGPAETPTVEDVVESPATIEAEGPVAPGEDRIRAASPLPVPRAEALAAPQPTDRRAADSAATTAPATVPPPTPAPDPNPASPSPAAGDAPPARRGEPISDGAERSSLDSVATAIERATAFDFDAGKPLAMRGVEIRPYALYRHIVVDAADTLFGLRWEGAVRSNPVVALRFDRRGRVRSVEVLRPSGYGAFDAQYLVSWLARWTAGGAELRALAPRELSAPFIVKLMFVEEPEPEPEPAPDAGSAGSEGADGNRGGSGDG